jgi:hypothetical protein
MGHGTLVTILGAEPARLRSGPGGRPSTADDLIRVVDAAVREVLAGLRPVARSRPESDAQVFPERLLSLRHAEALPEGTRRLRIGAGTVVTPLARDHLKRRGVLIQLGLPASARLEHSGEWAFGMAVEGETGTIQALRRSLLEDPSAWRELPAGLIPAVEWLLDAPGRGVLLIASEPALTVWRACQVRGIRAATAHEPTEVHSSSRGLGVNLLVVDPVGKSISWIRQLALAFRRGGAPRPPADLFAEELRCESPR